MYPASSPEGPLLVLDSFSNNGLSLTHCVSDHLRQNPDNRDFIYLQPAKTKSPEFDPYDLDIVLHSELDSPFFYTMSSTGCTLFRDTDAG